MARRFEESRDAAMQLSEEERGWLLEDLHDSVRTAEEADIEREWIELAERRAAEIDAGTATTVPADEALARVRAKLQETRRAARRG